MFQKNLNLYDEEFMQNKFYNNIYNKNKEQKNIPTKTMVK